jgi:UDP-N-acetylmuramoyl-L-alanyl-D-glutamate--2,6-diaminopimelate ligase
MVHKETTVATTALADLLDEATGAIGAIRVGGVQFDSRQVRPGDVFLALPGDVHDGRNYLAQAREAGAAALVVERGLTDTQRAAAADLPLLEVSRLSGLVGVIADRFYGHPSRDMDVVGITGTNGKTTTSRLLAQLLRRQFDHCGVIGTLGATLDNGVGEALNTTPDALSLQRQLAEWRDAGVTRAVLEVSSHSLVQGRVNGLQFSTAVFTNLTHDHLDYHGDMDSYGLAKARLFYSPGLRTAIINADDPFGRELAHSLDASVQCLRYSLQGNEAEISAAEVDYRAGGLEAYITTPWGSGVVHSPLAGDFNLANLLAAIAAACVEGVPFANALEAVPGLHGVAGRMEYITSESELQLVVDYAHTPDALEQALKALRAHTAGKLICVFGCGGDRDAAKRPVMGRVASELADRVILTSDNPRGEPALDIIADIEAGLVSAAEIEPDRAAAIALAVATAAPGDCVLVAGKGHESYQQIGARRLPFSDAAHIRLALAGRAAP